MKKKKNTNSQKESPQNKQHNNKGTPWPNLPKRLIKYIAKHPNTLESINFGLATKSWRFPSSQHCLNSDQTLPRLIVSDGADTPEVLPHFCSIEFQEEYCWSWYDRMWRRRYWPQSEPWTRILGCSHGIIIAADSGSSSTELYCTDPRKRWSSYFGALDVGPGRDAVPFRCAALSSVYVSYPDESYVMMVATGVSSPAFMFHRLHGETLGWIKKDCVIAEPNSHFLNNNIRRQSKRNGEDNFMRFTNAIGFKGKFMLETLGWIKKDCVIAEPNSHFLNNNFRRQSKRNGEDNFMRFTNAIGFKGKFYALSSQGTLALIEEIARDRFEIVALGKTRAVPSVPARGFRECLIESDGEILVVFLVREKSANAVDSVEVYRLRFDDLAWVKMKGLGEQRTLFVGNDCCISVCAEKVGCRGNRVYFTQPRGGGGACWWEFDMEFGTISRPDWAERASVNGSGGNGNSLEWDKPIISYEEGQDSSGKIATM